MYAATGNHPDFYPYLAELGAVGVYENEDGTFTSAVTIDGEEVPLSDAAWGCVAYSPITSLYEADMAMAFEYGLDETYTFNTDFQKTLAGYLSEEYMQYINEKQYSVREEEAGLDLDGDGALASEISLTIERNPETGKYSGTYLDLYLATFTESLQWYLDNLSYAEGWTWFNEAGEALTVEEASSLSPQERAQAFLEGRYAAASQGGMGGFGGGMGRGEGGPMGGKDMRGEGPQGGNGPAGGLGEPGGLGESASMDGGPQGMTQGGDEMAVGTPDAGTTQASGSAVNSSSYSSYEEMLASYEADIAEVQAGDRFGMNQVSLYNPLAYIGAEGTENPAWVRMLCGAKEGDISMLNSLNLQLTFLGAGIPASIQWQWNGGHVPQEIFGESLSLYIDRMEGTYGEGSVIPEKEEPAGSAGEASEPTGTDVSDWISLDENGKASFSLASIASYRTAGASKACPGFDVIDYGQECYVFGSEAVNARHFSEWLLKVLSEHQDTLEPLF